MTSKELLKHIENAPSFMGGDVRYKGVAQSGALYIEDIKQICKDLEVLEILSKSINIKLQELDGYYFLQINNEPIRSITKEEYEILKEWKDGR